MNRQPRNRIGLWHRSVALTVALMFTWTNVVLPSPSVSGAQVLQWGAKPIADPRILSANPFGVGIDEKDGAVSDFYAGDSDLPLVIHLQDAHGNISAQHKIRRIMNSVIRGEVGDPFIYCLVEGASGFVGRAPLKAFLDLGLDPTESLLAKGVMHGPELAALDNAQIVLWGIEDAGLYDQNLKAWGRARAEREGNRSFINLYKNRLHDAVAHATGKPVRLLRKAEDALSQETPDLEGVSGILQRFMRVYRYELMHRNARKPISIVELKSDFPNAYRFMQLEYLWEDARSELDSYGETKQEEWKRKREQKEEQRQEQKQEQKEMLEVQFKISPNRVEAAVESPPQEVVAAPLPTGVSLLPEVPATNELLDQMAIPLVGDLFEGKEKRKTTTAVEKYLRATEDLDIYELMDELKRLILKLKKYFYQDEDEETLDLLNEKTNLLAKLVELSLTPQEYGRLRELGSAERSQLIGEYRRHAGKRNGLKWGDWNIAANLDYYDAVVERDGRLFANLEDFLFQHADAPFVFLFTGGFHAAGMSHQLRENGLSYLGVQPAIESLSTTDAKRYEAALRWQSPMESTLLQRTALSGAVAPLVQENTLQLVASRIIKLGDVQRMKEVFSRARADLITAFDRETALNARPQLESLGLADREVLVALVRTEFIAAVDGVGALLADNREARIETVGDESSLRLISEGKTYRITPGRLNPVSSESTEEIDQRVAAEPTAAGFGRLAFFVQAALSPSNAASMLLRQRSELRSGQLPPESTVVPGQFPAGFEVPGFAYELHLIDNRPQEFFNLQFKSGDEYVQFRVLQPYRAASNDPRQFVIERADAPISPDPLEASGTSPGQIFTKFTRKVEADLNRGVRLEVNPEFPELDQLIAILEGAGLSPDDLGVYRGQFYDHENDNAAGIPFEILIPIVASAKETGPEGPAPAVLISDVVGRDFEEIFRDLEGPDSGKFTNIPTNRGGADTIERTDLYLNPALESQVAQREFDQQGSQALRQKFSDGKFYYAVQVIGEKDVRTDAATLTHFHLEQKHPSGVFDLALRRPGSTTTSDENSHSYRMPAYSLIDLRLVVENGLRTYYVLIPNATYAEIKDGPQSDLLDFTLGPELTAIPQRVVLVSHEVANSDTRLNAIFTGRETAGGVAIGQHEDLIAELLPLIADKVNSEALPERAVQIMAALNVTISSLDGVAVEKYTDAVGDLPDGVKPGDIIGNHDAQPLVTAAPGGSWIPVLLMRLGRTSGIAGRTDVTLGDARIINWEKVRSLLFGDSSRDDTIPAGPVLAPGVQDVEGREMEAIMDDLEGPDKFADAVRATAGDGSDFETKSWGWSASASVSGATWSHAHYQRSEGMTTRKVFVAGEKEPQNGLRTFIGNFSLGTNSDSNKYSLWLRKPGENGQDEYKISKNDKIDLVIIDDNGTKTFFVMVPDTTREEIVDRGQEELLDFRIPEEYTDIPQRVVIVSEATANTDPYYNTIFSEHRLPETPSPDGADGDVVSAKTDDWDENRFRLGRVMLRLRAAGWQEFAATTVSNPERLLQFTGQYELMGIEPTERLTGENLQQRLNDFLILARLDQSEKFVLLVDQRHNYIGTIEASTSWVHDVDQETGASVGGAPLGATVLSSHRAMQPFSQWDKGWFDAGNGMVWMKANEDETGLSFVSAQGVLSFSHNMREADVPDDFEVLWPLEGPRAALQDPLSGLRQITAFDEMIEYVKGIQGYRVTEHSETAGSGDGEYTVTYKRLSKKGRVFLRYAPVKKRPTTVNPAEWLRSITVQLRAGSEDEHGFAFEISPTNGRLGMTITPEDGSDVSDSMPLSDLIGIAVPEEPGVPPHFTLIVKELPERIQAQLDELGINLDNLNGQPKSAGETGAIIVIGDGTIEEPEPVVAPSAAVAPGEGFDYTDILRRHLSDRSNYSEDADHISFHASNTGGGNIRVYYFKATQNLYILGFDSIPANAWEWIEDDVKSLIDRGEYRALIKVDASGTEVLMEPEGGGGERARQISPRRDLIKEIKWEFTAPREPVHVTVEMDPSFPALYKQILAHTVLRTVPRAEQPYRLEAIRDELVKNGFVQEDGSWSYAHHLLGDNNEKVMWFNFGTEHQDHLHFYIGEGIAEQKQRGIDVHDVDGRTIHIGSIATELTPASEVSGRTTIEKHMERHSSNLPYQGKVELSGNHIVWARYFSEEKRFSIVLTDDFHRAAVRKGYDYPFAGRIYGHEDYRYEIISEDEARARNEFSDVWDRTFDDVERASVEISTERGDTGLGLAPTVTEKLRSLDADSSWFVAVSEKAIIPGFLDTAVALSTARKHSQLRGLIMRLFSKDAARGEPISPYKTAMDYIRWLNIEVEPEDVTRAGHNAIKSYVTGDLRFAQASERSASLRVINFQNMAGVLVREIEEISTHTFARSLARERIQAQEFLRLSFDEGRLQLTVVGADAFKATGLLETPEPNGLDFNPEVPDIEWKVVQGVRGPLMANPRHLVNFLRGKDGVYRLYVTQELYDFAANGFPTAGYFTYGRQEVSFEIVPVRDTAAAGEKRLTRAVRDDVERDVRLLLEYEANPPMAQQPEMMSLLARINAAIQALPAVSSGVLDRFTRSIEGPDPESLPPGSLTWKGDGLGITVSEVKTGASGAEPGEVSIHQIAVAASLRNGRPFYGGGPTKSVRVIDWDKIENEAISGEGPQPPSLMLTETPREAIESDVAVLLAFNDDDRSVGDEQKKIQMMETIERLHARL
ncbi:MAG: hypothetical protein Q8R76_03260, partial [Candidatus Omnitrophota bacterium]|nr:hypothetical protein [Candidatus Omnitrophota bacterium]